MYIHDSKHILNDYPYHEKKQHVHVNMWYQHGNHSINRMVLDLNRLGKGEIPWWRFRWNIYILYYIYTYISIIYIYIQYIYIIICIFIYYNIYICICIYTWVGGLKYISMFHPSLAGWLDRTRIRFDFPCRVTWCWIIIWWYDILERYNRLRCYSIMYIYVCMCEYIYIYTVILYIYRNIVQ